MGVFVLARLINLGAAPVSVKLPTAGVTGVPEESSGVWPVNVQRPDIWC
jgi:hypothetical protein